MSPEGIEPSTNWLKASCSTTELRALLQNREARKIRAGRGAVKNGPSLPEIASTYRSIFPLTPSTLKRPSFVPEQLSTASNVYAPF